MWPKTLGATEMSNASGSELIKIPVSFAFRYWDRIDPTAQGAAEKGSPDAQASAAAAREFGAFTN